MYALSLATVLSKDPLEWFFVTPSPPCIWLYFSSQRYDSLFNDRWRCPEDLSSLGGWISRIGGKSHEPSLQRQDLIWIDALFCGPLMA